MELVGVILQEPLDGEEEMRVDNLWFSQREPLLNGFHVLKHKLRFEVIMA